MNAMIEYLLPYQFLIIPFACLIITQAVKVVIDVMHGHPGSMNSYGGMPSTHSSLFASVAIMALLEFGVTSFHFAFSFVVYLTTIRDAAGIRQHLGQHGQILKDLIVEHKHDHHHTITHEKIVTRLGHTPLQVTIGSIFGVVLTLVMHWVLNR